MKEIAPKKAVALSYALITVRESWRSLLTKPEQTLPYLDLAKAYNYLPPVSTELRNSATNSPVIPRAVAVDGRGNGILESAADHDRDLFWAFIKAYLGYAESIFTISPRSV